MLAAGELVGTAHELARWRVLGPRWSAEPIPPTHRGGRDGGLIPGADIMRSPCCLPWQVRWKGGLSPLRLMRKPLGSSLERLLPSLLAPARLPFKCASAAPSHLPGTACLTFGDSDCRRDHDRAPHAIVPRRAETETNSRSASSRCAPLATVTRSSGSPCSSFATPTPSRQSTDSSPSSESRLRWPRTAARWRWLRPLHSISNEHRTGTYLTNYMHGAPWCRFAGHVQKSVH